MDDASALASKLKDDRVRSMAFLLSLGEAEWSVQVYTEGELWTVRSVLAHLLSAERAFVHLFREVQTGGEGVADGFSVNTFNEREQARYEKMSSEDLLESFQRTRARLIDLVATLTDDELEHVGRHPFLGMTSLREMVRLTHIHAQSHLRDVRRALGSR